MRYSYDVFAEDGGIMCDWLKTVNIRSTGTASGQTSYCAANALLKMVLAGDKLEAA